ncbi:hypothetical protein AA313_de0203701 [Arthrobotrys entomopaga]|nr:hypothetical protein AA313_de0203701 [Arthrobotrys entomopaga]
MPQPSTSRALKGSDLKKKLVELATTIRPDKPVTIYVTSSTGHQIAEDGGGGGGVTGWREDRNRKLKSQFSGTGTLIGTKTLQTNTTATTSSKSGTIIDTNTNTNTSNSLVTQQTSTTTTPKQIFKNCTIYINGNTSPSGISDVELKRLLTSHGATVSYHLARRQVTHIILTNPSSSAAASSLSTQSGISSSGTPQTSITTTTLGPAILSSRKIELEMKGRVKSKIHYVSVEWALSSINEGKRLAETKFPVIPLREARQGTLMDCKKVKASSSSSRQRSLMDMMMKK